MSEHRCKHCGKEFVRPLKWERTYVKAPHVWEPICGRCANRLDQLKNDGFLGTAILSTSQLRKRTPTPQSNPPQYP